MQYLGLGVKYKVNNSFMHFELTKIHLIWCFFGWKERLAYHKELMDRIKVLACQDTNLIQMLIVLNKLQIIVLLIMIEFIDRFFLIKLFTPVSIQSISFLLPI